MADESRDRHSPLEMHPEEFRRAGHRLVDDIARLLEQLPKLPVTRAEGPRAIRRLLPEGGVPAGGADPADLLDETAALMAVHSLFNGHPRFFGYVTSSAAPIGALADLLAAAVNPNVGGWQLSPLASEIEGQSVRWIADLLGFPRDGGGLLVSGGNMANFVGFLVGRRAIAGADMRRDGVAGQQGRLLAYASEETHTWIQKAADLFGHGTESIRWIPVDSTQRARLDGLRERILRDRAAGDRPFLLVGNAGTVSTGAVDPLGEMADLAHELGLRFHVDGAYGAFAVLAPEAPPELAALARADSIAIDPHKWLYAPLEAGCVLVRDPEALADTFGYTPPYYHFEDEDEPRTNYYEIGMQNSRGFRALKVWLGLRQVGRDGYARMISDDIRLTRAMSRAAEAHPELESVAEGLSIACFRFVPADLAGSRDEREAYLDRLNEELLERLKSSGELFLSNAVVHDRFVLRACIVNFRTTLDDVEAVPGIVARHGREIDRTLRPDALRASS